MRGALRRLPSLFRSMGIWSFKLRATKRDKLAIEVGGAVELEILKAGPGDAAIDDAVDSSCSTLLATSAIAERFDVVAQRGSWSLTSRAPTCSFAPCSGGEG